MEQDIKQEIVSIQLNGESTIPLYVQLYLHIKQMIEQGKLSTNLKMPPIRWMAEKLQVNPGTVVRAYKELEKERLFDQQVGQRKLCGRSTAL